MLKQIFTIVLMILIITIAGQFIQVGLNVQTGIKIADRSVRYEQEGTGLKRILFAGDSMVVGTGASDPKYSVAGRFGKDFPNYTIDNVAVNGLRLAEFTETLDDVEGMYDLIIMQVGGNDVIRLYYLDDLENDARRAVRAAKEKSDKIVWLTLGNLGSTEFFPWPVNYFYDYWTKKSREVFLRVAAEEEILYIDLYRPIKKDPFSEDIKRFYAPDKLHISDDGYAVWYNYIREIMEKNGLDF